MAKHASNFLEVATHIKLGKVPSKSSGCGLLKHVFTMWRSSHCARSFPIPGERCWRLLCSVPRLPTLIFHAVLSPKNVMSISFDVMILTLFPPYPSTNYVYSSEAESQHQIAVAQLDIWYGSICGPGLVAGVTAPPPTLASHQVGRLPFL